MRRAVPGVLDRSARRDGGGDPEAGGRACEARPWSPRDRRRDAREGEGGDPPRLSVTGTGLAPPRLPMEAGMELVHERDIAIVDERGRAYTAIRVFAYPQPGGTWAGMLEFLPADGAHGVRSARETTQSSPDAVAYWATGLEPLYFEGALARALRQPAGVMPASAPAAGARPIG